MTNPIFSTVGRKKWMVGQPQRAPIFTTVGSKKLCSETALQTLINGQSQKEMYGKSTAINW